MDVKKPPQWAVWRCWMFEKYRDWKSKTLNVKPESPKEGAWSQKYSEEIAMQLLANDRAINIAAKETMEWFDEDLRSLAKEISWDMRGFDDLVRTQQMRNSRKIIELLSSIQAKHQ